MIEEELLRLEREAEQRVRDAHDREIDLGGPGSTRRASEAMDAPMLEAASIRKMRQRFGDLRMEIDHQENFLRKADSRSGLPQEVLHRRRQQAEGKLAGLRRDYQTLEKEAVQRWPVGTAPEQLERRAREAEGLAGGSLHRLKRDIAVSPALTGARKAQLNALADAVHSGRQSPRDTPRAEDAAEARRRPHPLFNLGRTGDRPESKPQGPLRPVHPSVRAAQPDASVQREIGRLRGEKADAEREREELAHDDSLSPAASRERHRRLRERIAGLDQQIRTQESEAERLRLETRERKERAAADATHRVPVTNGEVDKSKLVPGRLYRVEDGSLFVWDGKRFGRAQRTDKADAEGRTFRAMPETGSVPMRGHPGTPETPEEIVANIGRLSEASGVKLDGSGLIMALAREVERRKELLEDALRRGPDSEQERTRNIERGYRSLAKDLRAAYADVIEQATPEKVSAAEMADRMDDPGRAGSAVRSVIRPGGEMLADIPIFMAVNHSLYMRDVFSSWDRIDDGDDYLELGLSPNSYQENLVRSYAKADAELRARMRKRYGGLLDPRQTALYEAGMDLHEALEEVLETNPRFADEFLATKLPAAIGAVLAEGATVAVLSSVGIPAPVSEAMLGMMGESSRRFREALEDGKPIDEAYREFGFGALMGMTEGLPLAEMMGRADKVSGGAIGKLLREAARKGTEGAVMEAIKQARKELHEKGTADADQIAAAFTAEAIVEFTVGILGGS